MKRILALLLAVCMIAAMFAGCSAQKEETPAETPAAEEPAAEAPAENPAAETPAEEPAAEPESDSEADGGYAIEVLSLESSGDFGGPNPFRHSTRGPGSTKMHHVFDSLLQAGTEDFIPWLAESWALSDDGLTYTFTLHQGATWHDGEPVTAEDVAFTIDYYAQYPNNGGNLFTADSSIIESYEIVDDYTIVIHAKEAQVTNTENIGTTPIIPKHIWESVDDPYNYDGDDKYIGCGMYKLISYDPATGSYQFEAYENYYGHQAAAHYIDYVPVSDSILAFENGDIVMCDVSADLYDSYAARDDIAMIAKNDEMGYRLMVNMEKLTDFQDAEVRGALYQALNRQAMVDSVFQGLGHIASAGYVPQTNPYYCKDVKTYDYDPDYAKSVLEPLGLSLRLVAGQDTPAEATLAELIKMNLESVGITVTVESYDVATRDSMATTGDYDLLLTYHGGWNSEPLSMLRAIYGAAPGSGSKWASFGYSNEELQSLLASLPYLLDLDERSAAYDDAQILISTEIPNLPLITQVSYAMYHPDVYDYWKAPFNSTQFANSRLSYTSDTDV